MKKHFVSVVVLLAAIGCLHASTPSAAQSLALAAQANALLITNTAPHQTAYQPTAPQNTQEQPMYPIPRTMFEEVIATYRIGYSHKAMYANLTGDQMWFVATSKFGKPNQQSAISEARQSCEDHAVRNNLDPSKCVPVAVDDRQVFDPGPIFSAAERLQDRQQNMSTLVASPQE